MRRRNLMIGLGVLATGSGATALTGATLSNTVSPAADFRVNVDPQGLVVERNSTQPFDGSSIDTTGANNDIPDGSLVYEDKAQTSLDDLSDFAAVANKKVNGGLEFGVLVPFDEIPTTGNGKGDVTYEFPNLLQVTNNDGTEQQVVIRYDNKTGGTIADEFGYVTSDEDDLDSDGSFVSSDGSGAALSYDQVAKIFNFSVDSSVDPANDGHISPLGADESSSSNQDPEKAAKIGSSETTGLSVEVEFTESLGDLIKNEVENQNLDSKGGQIRLLDQVFFSTVGNMTEDTSSGTQINVVSQ